MDDVMVDRKEGRLRRKRMIWKIFNRAGDDYSAIIISGEALKL